MGRWLICMCVTWSKESELGVSGRRREGRRWMLTIVVVRLDQRCCWQRLWPTERCRRREEDGFYTSGGHCVRCVLREYLGWTKYASCQALHQAAGLTSCAAHLQNPSRHVELDIDIGADARDWSAIQASEKLKPVETELRRIEESVNEIVQELEYLRIREQKLRDTNESTNERVKWFALGTMGMLVGLGAWQVVYLRAYFRYVMTPHFGVDTSLGVCC